MSSRSYLSTTLVLANLACALSFLSACSIKQIDKEEVLISPEERQHSQIVVTDELSYFLSECDKCSRGDISKLDELIALYRSTYTSSLNWNKDSFKYQYVKPTLAFERCAQQAQVLGKTKGFASMLIKQGQVARTARYFYAHNDYTQGAFWLQRLVNIKGEESAYEIAGRIFVQDARTLKVGVRLLEQSARLGNRNARQILLGLMMPSSLYYQQITQNVEIAADNTGEKEDKQQFKTEAEKARERTEQLKKVTALSEELPELSTSISQLTRARAAQQEEQAEKTQEYAQKAQEDNDTATPAPATNHESPAGHPENRATLSHAEITSVEEALNNPHEFILEQEQNHAQENSLDKDNPPLSLPSNDAEAAIENSSDFELNVPLEYHEQMTKHIQEREAQNLLDAYDQSSEESTETGDNTQTGAASSKQESGSKNILSIPERKQLENLERLQELQRKAQEAERRVQERVQQSK